MIFTEGLNTVTAFEASFDLALFLFVFLDLFVEWSFVWHGVQVLSMSKKLMVMITGMITLIGVV